MPLQVSDRYTRIWQPHAKQVEFIQIPFSIFEALYGGAAGGGKSELLLMLPILYGWHESPRFHGIIFRRTFPQLEESLIPRSEPLYKAVGGRYDAGKHVWKFPSGAKIRFSYLDNDEHARDHDTAEYNYAAFDELTAFTRFMYTYITSRVRSSVPGLPALVRGATNPGNEGHMWVRDRFVAPAPDGGVKLYDSNSETHRIFIKARLTDNPYLLEADPGYLRRLRLLPEAEQRAKIDGDWWVFSGQVFTEWRDPFFGSKFATEPKNACHIIDDFIPPLYWPRIIAADWGWSAKTWVGWGAISPQKRVILYREYTNRRVGPSIWGADVVRLSRGEEASIRRRVLDPSGWAHRGDEQTIAAQLDAATGWSWSKADNDRLGGKLLLHDYLRWKPRPLSFEPAEPYDAGRAADIYRNFGGRALDEYRAATLPELPEENLPRLLVCKSCVEFRKVIPSCVYETKEGRPTEDVADFDGDDPYDGGRYLIKAAHHYFDESIKEHAKVEALDAIVQRLDQTGDWNTYYRQMNKHEQAHTTTHKSVSRGRRRGRHFVAR